MQSRVLIRNTSEPFLLTTSGVGQITSFTLVLRVKSFEEKPPFDIYQRKTVNQVLTNMVTSFVAIPAHFQFYGISTCVFELIKPTTVADIPFYTYHMGNVSAQSLLLSAKLSF